LEVTGLWSCLNEVAGRINIKKTRALTFDLTAKYQIAIEINTSYFK